MPAQYQNNGSVNVDKNCLNRVDAIYLEVFLLALYTKHINNTAEREVGNIKTFDVLV